MLGILSTIARISLPVQCLVRWKPKEQPILIRFINLIFVTLRVYTSVVCQYCCVYNTVSSCETINSAGRLLNLKRTAISSFLEFFLSSVIR